MEENIRKMIACLQEQVKEKVPEKGTFPVVYEKYENTGKKAPTHVLLKVTEVPVKGSEDKRYLILAVLDMPNPYGCERVIGYGSTHEIINILDNQDDDLLEEIMKAIPEMVRSLRGL